MLPSDACEPLSASVSFLVLVLVLVLYHIILLIFVVSLLTDGS